MSLGSFFGRGFSARSFARWAFFSAAVGAGGFGGANQSDLPAGVIVGSAVISRCVRNCAGYEWHLTAVRRYKRPRKPTGRPQPVWFRPW